MTTKVTRPREAPPGEGLVSGQQLTAELRGRAKELRRRMQPAESVLWNALRRDGLDCLHFRRQQIIDGYIVDFYCHSAGVVVEVDGPVHEGQTEYDAHRDACLCGRGLVVLRILNEDVMRNLEEVQRRIRSAAGCGRPGGRELPFPPASGEGRGRGMGEV